MFPRYLNISIILACALLSGACAQQAVSMGTQAPSIVSQADDRHVLGGNGNISIALALLSH